MSKSELRNTIEDMHRTMDLTLDEDDTEMNDSIDMYEGGTRTSRLASVSITARLSLNKEELSTTLDDFFTIRKRPDFRN